MPDLGPAPIEPATHAIQAVDILPVRANSRCSRQLVFEGTRRRPPVTRRRQPKKSHGWPGCLGNLIVISPALFAQAGARGVQPLYEVT